VQGAPATAGPAFAADTSSDASKNERRIARMDAPEPRSRDQF
jgi:hypothetical protein